MNEIKKIEQKLTQFIKRYYTNELLKGIILFVTIGLLYLLGILLIEYFLWLSVSYRTALFWIFIGVELSLLYKFIGIPLFKLLGLKKGITSTKASQIIGNHFPEVSDKLLNLLQLKNSSHQTELLLASIEQKASELSPIPFKFAINFKRNSKYLKYLALPILIFLLFQFTGNKSIIENSYNRVINHSTAYIPPAPFKFIIKNKKLQVIENESFVLVITTKGKVIPEDLKINFNTESYFVKKTGFNTFEYEFKQLTESVSFYIISNNVTSVNYTINVVKVPSIVNFVTSLDYPSHTGKKDEALFNTGNITIPEGTIVNWKLTTKQTDKVEFTTKDTTFLFKKNKSIFEYSNRIYNNLSYQISTTNTAITNYEQLNFKIQTVKDEYPEINIQSKVDSLDNQVIYFLGKLSDDYGLTKLQLVYKEVGSKKNVKHKIKIPKSNFHQFTFSFPGNLSLEKGKNYEYYFEVFDNDVLHNYKKTKSQIYNYNKLSDKELTDKQFHDQKETIDNLQKNLNQFNKQEKELEEIKKTQKEKNELNWNDKNKLKQFFKRQEQQESLMKKFNKDLQRNLEEFQKEKVEEDVFKEELQERLKTQEKDIEKNEKLLEELQNLQEKLQNEDLLKKIEKLSKENKNQERSLEQILELTKRYYVSKKFEKITNNLEELSKKQEELSHKTGDENTANKQNELSKEFKELQKELDELQKDNNELKQPMNLDSEKSIQEDITKEQKDASDKLEKNKQQNAKENQQKAAKKMQEMSAAMHDKMQSSSSEEMEEDVKTLRQILDNLIFYSFEQEDLLNDFKNIHNNNYTFPEKLKQQYILKDHFNHVDDSLFALSLRIPKISEHITKEITDVHFNINKSIERFSDQKVYLGVSNQQYALTAANNLANLLSDVLNQMQNSMNKSGSGMCEKPGGSGKGFQLSDIIKKQGQLIEKMGKGKPGDKGKKGSSSEKGESGKPGKVGKSVNVGGNGNNPNENSSGKLYEIYKQQQELKNALKELLGKSSLQGNAGNLLKKMEDIESQLLDKGFHESILQKMSELKHELLKLDQAAFEQGEDNKRESNTNNNSYINSSQQKIPSIEQYFNEVEILNRQALPLQPIYKKKVKQYFNNTDD